MYRFAIPQMGEQSERSPELHECVRLFPLIYVKVYGNPKVYDQDNSGPLVQGMQAKAGSNIKVIVHSTVADTTFIFFDPDTKAIKASVNSQVLSEFELLGLLQVIAAHLAPEALQPDKL